MYTEKTHKLVDSERIVNIGELEGITSRLYTLTQFLENELKKENASLDVVRQQVSELYLLAHQAAVFEFQLERRTFTD